MSNEDSLQKIKTMNSLKTQSTKGSDKKKSNPLMANLNKVLASLKLNTITKKQWQDIALFSVACYVMYEYGGELSGFCDKMMPNE